MNSAKVRLLGSQRLVRQLIGLERNTTRGGKDSIDHARGAHDDLANAAPAPCWPPRPSDHKPGSAVAATAAAFTTGQSSIPN